MKTNQNGFSAVEGLLFTVLLGLIGLTGWYVWQSTHKTDTSNKAVSANSNATTKIAPASKTELYTSADALKLVQDTYITTSAYVKRTTNADQGEVDSVKSNLSSDLYISMSNYLKNQTDSGHDQFTCAQITSDSYNVVAGTVSNKSIPVYVNQKSGDTTLKVTYTVDLASLKITAVTCPQ